MSKKSVVTEAQEIQLTGPLKGAPSVREMRMYREGRFSLEPGVAFTLLDEYRRAIFVGAKARYNFKEWISVDIWGAYALGDPVTNLTSQIDQTAPRDVRTAPNVCPGAGCFGDQVSKMTWVVAPEVTFIPFRGKLSIFEKIMVDTDAYVFGGAAFVGVEERGECGGSGQKSCSDPLSFARVACTAIAPTFGVGLTFYPAKWINFSLEYRGMPFDWNRPGFDSRGSGSDGSFPDGKVDSQDRTFAFNSMFAMNVGFFFQKPRVSE